MEILKELEKKYTNIELYCDESGDWEDQGVEAYKEEKYEVAKENFEKVIVAIPDHFNGYEMSAYAKYMLEEVEEAVKYMEKALEIATGFEGESKIDEETIDGMKENLLRMTKKESLNTQYISEIME